MFYLCTVQRFGWMLAYLRILQLVLLGSECYLLLILSSCQFMWESANDAENLFESTWPDIHVWQIIANLQHCYYSKYWKCAYVFCLSYADGERLYIYKVMSPPFLNFLLLIFLLRFRCCKWTVDQIIKKLSLDISLLWGQRLSASYSSGTGCHGVL